MTELSWLLSWLASLRFSIHPRFLLFFLISFHFLAHDACQSDFFLGRGRGVGVLGCRFFGSWYVKLIPDFWFEPFMD